MQPKKYHSKYAAKKISPKIFAQKMQRKNSTPKFSPKFYSEDLWPRFDAKK